MTRRDLAEAITAACFLLPIVWIVFAALIFLARHPTANETVFWRHFVTAMTFRTVPYYLPPDTQE